MSFALDRSPRSHYDVIHIVTSFATELATPTVTDVRTYVTYGHLTAFNIEMHIRQAKDVFFVLSYINPTHKPHAGRQKGRKVLFL